MHCLKLLVLSATILFSSAAAFAASAEPSVAPKEKAKAEEQRVSLAPSSRPAYVGIHGGTAPISLFRNENGKLVAITGQTGNDFSHILNGGNSSLRTLPATNNTAQVATENAAPTPTVVVQKIAAPANTPVKDVPAAPPVKATANPPVSNPKAIAASLNGASLHTVPLAEIPASFEILPNISNGNAPILFASSSGAISSEGKLTPFGLTIADSPATVYQAIQHPPVIVKPVYAPLRLHDYRSALNSGKRI